MASGRQAEGTARGGWDAALAEVDGASDSDAGVVSPVGWQLALAEVGGADSSASESGVGNEWVAALADVDAASPSESGSPPSSQEQGEAPGEEEDGLALVPKLPDRPQGLHGLTYVSHFSRWVDDEKLDMESLRVAHVIFEDEALVSTTAAKAKELGINRRDLPGLHIRLASASVHLERLLWANLEEQVVADPRVELLFYLQMASYDSADFKLQVTQKFNLRVGDVGGNVVVAHGGQEEVSTKEDDDIMLTEVAQGPKKVLQSDQTVHMFVRVGGKYAILRGNALTWLQVCDRNTAELYKKCMMEQLISSASCEKFNRKLRLACTDGAGSIAKAEKHIQISKEADGWDPMHITCRVHTVSGIHTRIFDLAPDDISGLIAVSLALAPAGLMGIFRSAVRAVLTRKVRLVQSVHLSGEAKDFKRLAQRAFLPDRAGNLELKVALERCCPGDWRDASSWPVVAGPEDTRKDILKAIFTILVPAMFGHAPFIFPKHRWTGAEHAFKDIGLPLNIHNLLPEAFEEFMQRMGRQAPDERQEQVPHADVHNIVAVAEPAADRDPAAAKGPKAMTWQEENRQYRAKALAWLQSRPQSRILCLALASQPVRSLMHKELEMAGATWETQQSAKAAMRHDLDSVIAGRTWPLLEAAATVHEEACMGDIVSMCEVSAFSCLGAPDMRMDRQTFVCQFLTRQGCAVHELLITKFRKFPYRLFLLLKDDSKLASIKAACEPSLDNYSKGFLAKYSEPTCVEALLELSTVAMAAKTATVLLECRNAQIRRYVVSSSVQTSLPTLTSVSAKFVLRKIALRDRAVRVPAGLRVFRKRISKSARESSSHAAATSVSRKRRGGGGAWRAFVSSRCKAVAAAVFAQLAREYRALSPQERSRLAQRGALATLLHRQGAISFGHLSRALGRAAIRDQAHRRVLRMLQNEVGATELNAIADLPVKELQGAAKRARTDEWLVKRMRREENHQAAQALVDWRQTTGMSSRNELVAKWPTLAPLLHGLHPQPAGGECMVSDWVSPGKAVIPRLVAALSKPEHRDVLVALQSDWDQKHLEHRHVDAEPLRDEPRKANRKPSCLDAGVCLCGQPGDLAWALVRFVRESMKKILKGCRWQDALQGCRVVVRLTGRAAGVEDIEPEANPAGPPARVAEQADWPSYDAFHFVGMMYWSPYRPTFRSCELQGSLEFPEDCLVLRAKDTYLTMFELCASLASRLQLPGEWQVRCYEVLLSQRPVLQCDPRRLEIQEVSGAPRCARCFPTQRRARRPADGWMALLEGLSDGASNSDSNHSGPEDQGDKSEESGGESGMSPSASEVASEVDPQATPEHSDAERMHDDPIEENAIIAEEQLAAEIDLVPFGALVDAVVVAAPDEPAEEAGDARVEELAPAAVVQAAQGQVPRPLLARGGIGAADFTVHLEFGSIRFYFSRLEMVAHCGNPAHGKRCRLSRSVQASAATSRIGQGRPVGLLGAWLMAGQQDQNLTTHEAHVRMRPLPDLDSRRSARLLVAGRPDGLELLAFERPQRDGEPEEPESVP